MKVNWKRLGLAILICEAVGILGSLFTFSAISNWYVFLNKPSFSPPNYLFGPVWTFLYFLMGVSLYLVMSAKGKVKNHEALKFFWIQLFLNGIWTPIFFGLRNPFLGLIVIILMLVAIILTIKEFLKINQIAALLLIPYLLWVSFATLLNFFIWKLN